MSTVYLVICTAYHTDCSSAWFCNEYLKNDCNWYSICVRLVPTFYLADGNVPNVMNMFNKDFISGKHLLVLKAISFIQRPSIQHAMTKQMTTIHVVWQQHDIDVVNKGNHSRMPSLTCIHTLLDSDRRSRHTCNKIHEVPSTKLSFRCSQCREIYPVFCLSFYIWYVI